MKQEELKTQLAKQRAHTYRISFTAVLFALTLVLSYLEGLLPPLGPFPIRYGLANAALILALLERGWPLGLALSVFKAFFALVTRGSLAAALSFCGGVLSVLVMYLANKLSRNKISYFLLSALGAVSHSSAQIILLIIMWGWQSKLFYLSLLPFLLIISLLSAVLSAFIAYLLKQSLPRAWQA